MSTKAPFMNHGVNIGSITSSGPVAVGEGATATLYVTQISEHREELVAALDQLREALSRTGLDRGTRRACEEYVESLEAEARKEQPDPAIFGTILGRVASHLRSAGVVLRETLALRQPIETIAGLVGTSLTLLKLW